MLKINFSENLISSFDLVIKKFPQVEIVVMTNNMVKEIGPLISKLPTLKYLDLSKNEIENIPD